MAAIAQGHQPGPLWRDLGTRLAHRIEQQGAHPARTLVLLPYFQLIPEARCAWAARGRDGFAPRFETTRSWAGQAAFEPGELDFSLDMGRDVLIARALLARAGLDSRADVLAPRLVEAAQQLAPLAAAVPPAERRGWAAQARAVVAHGMDAQPLQLEAAVAQVAVEWVAASSFASDALLQPGALAALDLLVVFEGLQPDPLHRTLARLAAGKFAALPLVANAPRGAVALHAATDIADEAERAAACVLRHIDAGRVPVALAATDRVLTRRIGALLGQRNVRMRDEQGWKLSTTRSAAQVMALLQAAAWDATSDQVIDWLKHVPGAPAGSLLGLERCVRRAGLREWRMLRPDDCGRSDALRSLLARANEWRSALAGTRTLPQWLEALGAALRDAGQFARLAQDDAGAQVLDALRLGQGGAADLQRLGGRMTLAEFRVWVDAVLEAESFKPAPARDAQVVVLPFTQTLARSFAAIVLPGCDEQRMPAAPEPAGPWTAAQRRALGLPAREQLEQEQRGAWLQALQIAHADVLWRVSDDHAEALLPSPLVQALLAEGRSPAADPRGTRDVAPMPVDRPQPVAPALRVDPLSASGYEDLRRCPYRFFALRQLGLKEAEELDTEVDKRDFGNWIHRVLRQFHEELRDQGEPLLGRAALLDDVARAELDRLRLEDGEFLPFEAGWPGVRDGYLQWLVQHEARGARFVAGEDKREACVGDIQLTGYIDRIDHVPDGRLVIDYKTESLTATQQRVKDPGEDTQLAFYAALLGGDDVAAAYLNIDERGRIKEVPHPDVHVTRDQLRAAIATELGQIAAGAALPALGEGRACEFCAARGLCRKDWWS